MNRAELVKANSTPEPGVPSPPTVAKVKYLMMLNWWMGSVPATV